MGKVNIDLGALFGALTKTPTAQQNPAFGAEEQQYEPSFNYQTGKMDDIPSDYTSPAGGSIDPSLVKKYGTTNPVLSPTRMQHLFHPDQSQAIDSMNNQAIMHTVIPGIDNAAQLRVRAGNVGLLDPSLRPNTSPLSAAASGFGSLDTSPTYINQQNESLLTAQHGLPGTKAATDLNVGQYDLTASKGAIDRQQMEQSVISGDLVNRWNTAYGLTPQQISLAERQVKAELGFQGSVEQIREQALKNQFDEQSRLIPAEHNLSLTQTGNAQNIASETSRMWPYQKEALDNRMIGDAATSKYLPLQEPRGGKIDSSTGIITPFDRNPLGASQYESMLSMMHDINGNDTQLVPDQNGRMVKVKMPNSLHTPFNPLGNVSLPPSGSPMIKASSNGPAITPDSSGSMTPPVNASLSSTTLPSSLTPNNSVYSGGNYEKDNQVKIAGTQLQQLLKKYSTDPNMFDTYSTSALTGNADVDQLTDFMSKNLSKMSKEDRKTALSLMHKIQ